MQSEMSQSRMNFFSIVMRAMSLASFSRSLPVVSFSFSLPAAGVKQPVRGPTV
jgi:hypothetical protein